MSTYYVVKKENGLTDVRCSGATNDIVYTTGSKREADIVKRAINERWCVTVDGKVYKYNQAVRTKQDKHIEKSDNIADVIADLVESGRVGK